MTLLSLSIGSNINPASNIREALTLLQAEFVTLSCSAVYESEAVGFDGDNFMNLVVIANVDKPLAEITQRLKAIEDQLGRNRDQPRFSGRTMDIDILSYGDETGADCGLSLPRDEITKNAFVLWPLAEMLPDEVHAPSNKTYGALWAEFDKTSQKLWPIDFDWPWEATKS
ncbi:MAG: 2-amino-4-hydroxy-6-hydroxymethyldihydropteridine diphosphokinase [Pseudohongiellaceae bacterium]